MAGFQESMRETHIVINHLYHLANFLLLNSLMNVCWSEVTAAGFPRIEERDARPVAACQFIFSYLTLLLIYSIKFPCQFNIMIFFVENGKYPNFGIEHFSFPYLFIWHLKPPTIRMKVSHNL